MLGGCALGVVGVCVLVAVRVQQVVDSRKDLAHQPRVRLAWQPGCCGRQAGWLGNRVTCTPSTAQLRLRREDALPSFLAAHTV